MQFIPRVEPIHKRRRTENDTPASSPVDPNLVGMRGREEEGASDEIITTLHLAYLDCSTSSEIGSSNTSSKSSLVKLEEALNSFIHRYGATLRLGRHNSPHDADDVTVKKVSPESLHYNSQARPAAGSLLSVVIYLSRLTQLDLEAKLSKEVIEGFLAETFGEKAPTPLVRIAHFATWLCQGLETARLWPPNNGKKNVEASPANDVDPFCGSSLGEVIKGFLDKADGQCAVPLCIQLQRLELLAWLLAATTEHNGTATVEENIIAILGLINRVAVVLGGGVGAEHHTHNARRNIAAWKHMSQMLKYFSVVGGQKETSKAFIQYLDESILPAFERRDRGISTMANLYRRRLQDTRTAFDGTTLEDLHMRWTEQHPQIADKGPTDKDPALQHSKGFHAHNSEIAQSSPTEVELHAARKIFCAAFGVDETLIISSMYKPLLTLVAQCWLKPLCVAAA